MKPRHSLPLLLALVALEILGTLGPFTGRTLAAPVPEVRSDSRKENGQANTTEVKPASRGTQGNQNSKAVPTISSPAQHHAIEQAPAVLPESKLRGNPATALGAPDSACHQNFADLLHARRMSRGAIATGIGLPAAGLTALGAKAAYDQIPKAEDRDSSRFRAKSKEEVISEAQSYLRNEFSSLRKPVGSFLNKDFSFGQWLLSAEAAQGGDPESFAFAGEAYANMVESAKKIRDSNLPFLEKVQAIRRLAVEKPGPISGYCMEKSTLSHALLAHCGNCESSMKTYISLLHDSGLKIEPPYELGIQTFTDHIQAVLLDRRGNKVIDLDSGNTETQVNESIFRPELLLWGYLTGQKADAIVSREKDLTLVSIPKSAARILKSDNPATDSIFDFGLSSSASSSRPTPAFGKRSIDQAQLGDPSLNQKKVSGVRSQRNGESGEGGGGMDMFDICSSEASESLGGGDIDMFNSNTSESQAAGTNGLRGSGFSTNGSEVAFADPAMRAHWNSLDPMGRWTLLKKIMAEEVKAIASDQTLTSAISAWEKGKSPTEMVPQKLYKNLYGLRSLVTVGEEIYECAKEDFPMKGPEASRAFADTPFTRKIEALVHRRGGEIADNPMAEIRRQNAMSAKGILGYGQWDKAITQLGNLMENDPILYPNLPMPVGLDRYHRTKAGNIYRSDAPLASLYATLSDRTKVDLGEEGSNTAKPQVKESDVELPQVSLEPGDYKGLVVLPRDSVAKKAPLLIPAEKMVSILHTGSMYSYGSAISNMDYLNVGASIADRNTKEVDTAARKVGMFSATTKRIDAEIEAMKAFSAVQAKFGSPRPLWKLIPNGEAEMKNNDNDDDAVKTAITSMVASMIPQITKDPSYAKPGDFVEKIKFDGKVSSASVAMGGTFYVKVSDQTLQGSFSYEPMNPSTIRISFGPLAWICQASCQGLVDFKELINDPKLKELKLQLEQSLDPLLLQRLKKAGAL